MSTASEVEQHFEEMKRTFFNLHTDLVWLSENPHYKLLSFLLENGKEYYNFFIHGWTVELETKLIQLYSEHPCLWDKNDKDYKNKEKKMIVYQQFVKYFNNRFSG